MREPFRAAVWGPGLMGESAMRELIRRTLNPLKKNRGRVVIVGSLHGLVPLGICQ